MNMTCFRFAVVGAAALLWLVATTVLGCAVQTNTTKASIVANSTTLCGQPTIEFQTLLENTKNFSRVTLLNTAATAFTATNFRLDYHQLPSLVSLRGRVLNRVGSHMVVAGCQVVQQVITTVIGNQTVCCQSAHLLDEVSISRIGLLVQLVLDRLASVIMVDFISTTPIFINSSYHTCPIPQNYQLWNFDSDLTNFGVVVTAFPHSSSSTSSLVWERVPMWALPCAWDTRHRPVVAMLNVNPEWLGREESDAIVMQEIQHHLLHALGFDATHDHADSGLPSGSINSDIPSTSSSVKSTWEANLGKYVVYWNASTITAASTTCTTVGIPMDDEYELATLGAYPTLLSQSSNPFATQAPWGSHYETRVMGTTDIMSSSEVGRHSWNISVVTKELFQSLLPLTGVTMRDQPSVPVGYPVDYTQDPLFAVYLGSTAQSQSMTMQQYLSWIQPPRVIFSTLAIPLSCTIIQQPCIPDQHTAEARSHYCSPAITLSGSGSSILQSCTPDFKGFMDCSAAAALTSTVPTFASGIPAAYRYQLGSRNLTGFFSSSDFCPLISDAIVEQTFVSCATARVDIPVRGNFYSNVSRCIESNVTLLGPRPADVSALRCVNMRCPYGLRLEVQMNGTNAWIPCPLSGDSGLVGIAAYNSNYTGTLRCEAAAVVCGTSNPTATSSAIPWTPAPVMNAAFNDVDGFAIEYYLAEAGSTFTRSQGKTLCGWMPNGSYLSFIPSLDFAVQLAAELAVTTTDVWIGATSPNTWDSMHGRYTISSLPIPAVSSGCYVLNLTAVRLGQTSNPGLVVSVACSSLHQVLCTRAWSNPALAVDFPSCPRFSRCSPTTLISDPRLHRSYFVSVNMTNSQQTLFSVSQASTLCSSGFLNAALFDLNNLVSLGAPTSTPTAQTPWYQALYSVINALQPNLVAFWTGLKWVAGTALPPWNGLVSNWPSSPSNGATFCFLLVPPGIYFTPLFAVSDCSATFPAVCYIQNPFQATSIVGYDYQFYFNHVPVSYSRVSQGTFCSQIQSNAFFSPILDNGPLFTAVISWYQSINAGAVGTSWTLSDENVTSTSNRLFLGSSIQVTSPIAASLLFPFASAPGNVRLRSSATSLFVPSATSGVTFDTTQQGTFPVALTNATSTPVAGGKIFAAPSSAQGAYICAVPNSQTDAAAWVSPICGTNATSWCDPINSATNDLATDSVFQMSRDLYDANAGATFCTSQGGQPLLTPLTNNLNFSFYNVTQIAASMLFGSLLQGQLFWPGLVVSGGVITSATGGTSYTHLSNPGATGFFAPSGTPVSYSPISAASLPNGTCLAAYFPSSPLVTAVDRVLFKAVDCRQPLFMPCKKPLISVSPVFVPWNVTSQTTPTIIGTRILPYFSFAVVPTPSTYNAARRICRGYQGDLAWVPRTTNITTALGNITTNANLATSTAKLWLGFSANTSNPSLQTVQNAFRIPFDASNYVVQTPTAFCLSMFKNSTIVPEPDCSVAMSFVCMRELLEFTVNPGTASLIVGDPASSSVAPGLQNSLPQIALTGYRSVMAFMINASAVDAVQISGTIPTFTVGSATTSVSAMFTSTAALFIPVPLLVRGVLQEYCCGNSAFNVQTTWVITVYPRPQLECSSSANGPFDYDASTIVDVQRTGYTLYCRIAVVSPDASYSLSFGVIATTRGENRPAALVATLQTSTFTSIQRNATASTADWGTFASSIMQVDVVPQSAGGIVNLTWMIPSCTGTCKTIPTATVIRCFRVAAPQPIFIAALPIANMWSNPAARLYVAINTPPFGTDAIFVNLTSSCSSSTMILSPTFLVWRSTSIAGVATNLSVQLVALSSSPSSCAIIANYWLSQSASSTGDTAAILSSQTSGSIVLGSVQMTSTSSSYYKQTLDPPYLSVYPGDVVTCNLTRVIAADSALNDLQIQYTFTPQSAFTIGGGTFPKITSTQSTSTLQLIVQNDSTKVSALMGLITGVVSRDYPLDVAAEFIGLQTLPQLIPPVRIILRKVITVLSLPTLIATGVSTSDSVVILSLPQAPLSTLNITIACSNTTYSQAFSSTVFVGPDSRISRLGDEQTLVVQVPLVPPDRLTDADIPFDTLWVCLFQISGSADVDPLVPSFNLIVRKRGRGSLSTTISIFRPGNVYLFVVSVQSSSLLPRAVSIQSTNITINGTVITLTQASRDVRASTVTADTTLTNCTVNITVPLAATYLSSIFITVQVQLNDTVWFRNPPSRSIELIPLIVATAVPLPSSFTFSQPIGTQTSQTLTIQLSALPRQADVTIQCTTSPSTFSGGAIAKFTPAISTVSMSSVTVTNSSLTRALVSMVGVVPNVIVSVSCQLQSTAGELFSTPSTALSLTMLSGASMQFVPLLQVAISILLFPGVLFIGSDNQRQVVVQISTLPMSNITVNLSMAIDSTGGLVPRVDPNNCITMTPNSWVTFGSSDAGSGNIVQNLTIQATCNSMTSAAAAEDAFFISMSMFANVTLKASLATTATNIDTSASAQQKLAVSFPILPKRVVSLVHAETDQPLTTATVYCGGVETYTPIVVNISALPLDVDSAATVQMNIVDDDEYNTTASFVYASPSQLQFSRKLSASLSRQWEWVCAVGFFTGLRANITQVVKTVVLGVDAPTEFASPGPSVQLILQKLLTVSVTFPKDITVGSLSISMSIAPELLPNDGDVLVIEFVSSCPASISLQHGNSVTWTPGMADSEQALRVLTYKSVQNCIVSLQLSQNSTARNYAQSLFNQTVNLYDPSHVSWLLYDLGKYPTVASDDITSPEGVQFMAQVDQANSFVSSTIIPVPLIGVTEFGNNSDFVTYVASLANNSVTTAVYAMSNVPDSGSSGLLAVLQANPSVIQCKQNSTHFPNYLMVSINAPYYTPSQDEMITLIFTQYALTRSDAPLSVSGTNVSFYVVASANKVSEVRETFYATSYIFAAVASLACGPALSTRAIQMSVILDFVSCPNTNWRIQKANAMNSVFRPIHISMGTDDNLGPYMAAAVYSVMLFAILIVFHVIAMFLVFARRLEMQTKTDASTGVAMAMLRFPSLELFPALYVVGIVFHSTLKVMSYSDDSSFRAASIVLFIIVGVGIPCAITYFSFFKVAPVVYQESDNTGCSKYVLYPRGRWVLDPFVLTIANEELRMSLQRYLPKYGMLLEELVGSTSHSRNVTLKVSRLTSSGHNHAHRLEAMKAADALEEKRLNFQIQQPTDSIDMHVSILDLIRWRVAKHYYVFDVFLAILCASTTVYEPKTTTGCMIEAWVLLALFLLQIAVFVVVQPFRRHCFNILHTIMSLCQCAAVVTTLVSVMSDSRGQYVQDAINGCLVALAAFMIIYIVIDVIFSIFALIQFLAKKGYKIGPKLLAIVGDGDDVDHHQIEIDENVPLRELLQGFVSEEAINMCNEEALSQKVDAEWEDVHLYEEGKRRGRAYSRTSLNTVQTQDVVL